MKKTTQWALFLVVLSLLAVSCATSKKIKSIRGESMAASIALPDRDETPELTHFSNVKSDTLKILDVEGREVTIMKAVMDENGEMVASDVIKPAVVTAKFRNVAERRGKVDLVFQIIVPEKLQDKKWELRFFPDLFVLGDSVRLQPVIITGEEFRNSQLRGYQLYEKFLREMMADSTKYADLRQLEIFLERNFPEIYAYKNDSSFVSGDILTSLFGVTPQEAIDHYDHRKAKQDQMYRRYVKVPIITEGIRLDTVIRDINGDFIYDYVQTINTRPKLKKAQIKLSGEIFDLEKKLYNMPASEPLTFYISSISAFHNSVTKYKTKIVERRAQANTQARIDFELGRDVIVPSLSNNASEINRIKDILQALMTNERYDLDSILVRASASPEGSYSANEILAGRRSNSVSRYFSDYTKHLRDSLGHQFVINLDDTYSKVDNAPKNIKFTARPIAENWDDLYDLVDNDIFMTEENKDEFLDLARRSANLDDCENAMHSAPFYKYMKENIYPKLRTVKFDFYLHRKGMVKDTVHTTVVDTAYMEGVQALKDMDYRKALDLLRPYEDYNTAVTYVALDRNISAYNILSKLERTAEVNYLLAIIYSRQGQTREAVECYTRACQQNRNYISRGNLDPEISALIKAYQLNKDPEDDFIY